MGWHDLRHTYGSHWAMKGAALKVFQERVLSAGVREWPWRHPVPSSALLIGLGETRWRDEL